MPRLRLDSERYTASLDGTSAGPFAFNNAVADLGELRLTILSFDQDGHGFYFDSVPESASLTLLSLGGLMILRRRR